METYRTRVTRKKAQGNVVLRGKYNHLNLLLIIGTAIGGNSRGGEALDTETLDINNQDCIRKRKNRAYLRRGSFRRTLVWSRIFNSTKPKLKRQI